MKGRWSYLSRQIKIKRPTENHWNYANRLLANYDNCTSSNNKYTSSASSSSTDEKDDLKHPLDFHGSKTVSSSSMMLLSSSTSAFTSTAWIPPRRSDTTTEPTNPSEDERIDSAQLVDITTNDATPIQALALHLKMDEAQSETGIGTTTLASSDQSVRNNESFFVTPSQGQIFKQQANDDRLEAKLHTLLSRDEIAICLRALGGQDISVILDDPLEPRMGGTTGIILTTGVSSHQLRSIADGLVRHLRRRKLQERGVVGAEKGAEGNYRDANESWFIIDAGNYIVHVMDQTTRTCLNLEDLWSGKDGLHRLDLLNAGAVEKYIYEHPVPDEYMSQYHGNSIDETLKQLEKIRWTVPRPPVVPKSKRKRRRNRRK